MRIADLKEFHIYEWICPECYFHNDEDACYVKELLKGKTRGMKTIECSNCGEICKVGKVF